MKKFQDIRSFFKNTNIRLGEATNDVNNCNNNTNTTTSTIQNNPLPSMLATVTISSGINSTKDKTDKKIEGREHLSDLGSLESGPSRPRINFPRSNFGDRKRSFSSNYYDIYSWLEYSLKEDKIYCFVCRQFSIEFIRDQNERFIKSGFCNWKKLNEVLKKHEQSSLHIQCTERFISYKHSVISGTVQEKLVTQHKEEIMQNREYLLKLIDVILCLVRQGLPLRGHREDSTSNNKGNFLEICETFAKYDNNFSNHLERHTSYCSPKIQNEIINIVAKLTLEEIVKEVRACGFFSLMVDEARCYKEQQLSIIIRYVKDLEVEERFLGFLNCSAFRDAQGLQKLILEFLDKCNMTNIPIIAQSYDGANVMSGKDRGLQARIKEIHPQAIYIHCLAHKLNLVIVDSCANISLATTFFNTLEALYIHFSQPGNHTYLIKAYESLGIKTSHEIGSLSSTRWNCRYKNCKTVLNNYDTIKDVLEEEISQAQDKNSVEALGILISIMKPHFVVSLFVFHSVFLITNVLSKYFQSKDATLGRASEIITSIIITFEERRNQFDDLWEEIKNFAEKREISLELVRISKKKRKPERLNDFHVESTLGKSNLVDLPSDIQPSEYWKINFYYQVMDNITSNFKYRFENLPLAQSVDSFIKLDLKFGKAFIQNYKDVMKIDTSVLEAETVVIKNILKNKSIEVKLENLKMEIKKDFTPNLYKLLQVAIGLPVSSAGCERSFSAMRRIKTWLRTTMNQERFSSMALLNIENKIIKWNITAQQVLDVFVEKDRKLKLI